MQAKAEKKVKKKLFLVKKSLGGFDYGHHYISGQIFEIIDHLQRYLQIAHQYNLHIDNEIWIHEFLWENIVIANWANTKKIKI